MECFIFLISTSSLCVVNMKSLGIFHGRVDIQLSTVKSDGDPVGHQAGEHCGDGGLGGVKVQDVPAEPIPVGIGAHRRSASYYLYIVGGAGIPQVGCVHQASDRVLSTDLGRVQYYPYSSIDIV